MACMVCTQAHSTDNQLTLVGMEYSVAHMEARMDKTQAVVTISDLKTRVSAVFDALGDGGAPVIITRDGRKAAVLISVADYDRLAGKSLDVDAREHQAGSRRNRESFEEWINYAIDAELRGIPPEDATPPVRVEQGVELSAYQAQVISAQLSALRKRSE